MKRITSITFTAVLILSFAVMGLAQQPTKSMEKQQTPAPAKTEHKAMMATAEHLKLTKDEMIALQNALSNAKVYKGKASGILDAATKRALRQYQQDNKLKMTGEPNEETLSKLGVSYAHNQTPAVAHSTDMKKQTAKKPESAPNKPDSKQN
jgi:peptidoglycan hydrolase-like protein with peptidoglycan-binding domain